MYSTGIQVNYLSHEVDSMCLDHQDSMGFIDFIHMIMLRFGTA